MNNSYSKGFQLFRNQTNQLSIMQNFLKKNINKKDSQRKISNLSFLSVGGGDGYFDKLLLSFLKKTNININYNILEPYDVFFPALSKNINPLMLEEKLNISIIQQPFEKYISTQKFDFIIFAHSLYYIYDRLLAIKRAKEMLLPKGEMLVFIETEEGLIDLQTKFFSQLDNDLREIFSSSNLKNILKKKKIFYKEEKHDDYIDFSDYLFSTNNQRELLLSFILNTEFAELKATLKREILDYLEKNILQKKGGKLLYHPLSIITIPQIRRDKNERTIQQDSC